MTVTVAISTVSDGTMSIRDDQTHTGVIENRIQFLATLPVALSETTRVRVSYIDNDYCRYVEVSTAQRGFGMTDGDVIAADALITRDFGHALFLPLADCIGAVIYDPIRHILMLSHLGRHSLEQNGGFKSVSFLKQKYGSDPKTLLIWLTPAPGKASYPMFAFENRSIKDVASTQLISAGIVVDNITDNTTDTTIDTNYFSHSEFLKSNRSEDGRHAIVAVMTD